MADKQYRAGLAVNAIVDLVTNEPVVTGGGRGWTARVTVETGGVYDAKGTGKAEALEALLALLKDQGGLLEPNPDSDDSCNSSECMASVIPECQCRCNGAFHGIGAVGGRLFVPVMIGIKKCKCGCGADTQRLFVPGHDARYHTAQRAAEAGLSVDDYRAKLRKDANDRAAANRRTKRAEAKVVVAAVPAGDDLPF